MSDGPRKIDYKVGDGLKPYGHLDVNHGHTQFKTSSVGVGLVHNGANHQAHIGVTQDRGGLKSFGGKPNTTFGAGFKIKF